MRRDRAARNNPARYKRETNRRLQRPVGALAHDSRPITHARPVRCWLITAGELIVWIPVRITSEFSAIVTDVRGLIRVMPIMTACAGDDSLDGANPQRRKLNQHRHQQYELKRGGAHAAKA